MRRHRRFRALICSLPLLLWAGGAACAPCPWYGSAFAHPDYAAFTETNKSRLGSLLVIQRPNNEEKGLKANESIGVAFLVDRRSGLFLTAAHVLAQAIKNNKTPEAVAEWRKELAADWRVDPKPTFIHARLASNFSTKITFDAAILHPTRDVALVRVAQPYLGIFAKAQPFELVFRKAPALLTPQVGVPRFAYIDQRIEKLMGEQSPGDSADDGQKYARAVENRAFEPTWRNGRAIAESHSRIRVAADVIEGDSGGPVILANGAALGVVHQQNNREELDAESVPFSLQDSTFLRAAAGLRRVAVIDVARRANDLGVALWRHAFTPQGGEDYLSNLDVAALIQELKVNHALIPELKDFLECAVSWASELRHGPLLFEIPGVRSFDQLTSIDRLSWARTMARMAQQLQTLKAPVSAYLLTEKAAENFVAFVEGRLSDAGEASKTTKCLIVPNVKKAGGDPSTLFGAMGLNIKQPRAGWCVLPQKDDQSANAFVELLEVRRTQFDLARANQFALTSTATQFAQSASNSAILASWIADGDPTKARAYELLGKLYAENGQPAEAAQSFTAAYSSYLKAALEDRADQVARDFSLMKSQELNKVGDYSKLIQSHQRIDAAGIKRVIRNPLGLRLP